MAQDQVRTVGEEFVRHYYSTFDSNRTALGPLYQADSLLSFEGETVGGAEAIVDKLAKLPFQRVQHQIQTIDIQPVMVTNPNSIIVFVSGQLVVDDSPNPVKFSQTFNLMPKDNTFWVHNDLFRLNYG